MALYGIKLLLLQSYKFNQIKKDKIMSIKVVQFLHSGEEYKRSEFITKGEETIKPWNTGAHKRKFLHAKGAYIDNDETTEEEKEGEDIYFWGEWEPDSIVTKIQTKVKGHSPQYIHKPFLRFKKSEQLTKGDKNPTPTNTDPFVFGDKGFYYSYCNQETYIDLKKLEPGSIILFGSNIKTDPDIDNNGKNVPYFALDTVFVVGPVENKLEYNKNTDLSDLQKFGPKHYCDIMNFKASGNNSNCSGNSNEQNDCKGSGCTRKKNKSKDCEKGSEFTCYRGVSFDDYKKCKGDPIKKMYSFIPCKIGSKGENGFEKVRLYDTDFTHAIINNKKTQGVKYTEVTLGESFHIWNTLCNIIKSQGFEKAVRLNYTEKKE